MEGNLGVVEEMLKRNPQLAWELDSQKSSPLHIAAAKGYDEIASLLLAAAPKVCWWRDSHGMNPIHIAAMYGHLKILEKLIEENPSPAREKVDCRQTVLHLCAKHDQLEALMVLVENFPELVLAEDDDGYTILHLAAVHKKREMIECLVKDEIIDKDIRNSKGITALQVLMRSHRSQDYTTSHIINILAEDSSTPEFMKFSLSNLIKLPDAKLKEIREIVMVVMVLIATMAFQAVVSPPGGVWQDDSSTHKAGEAVIASTHPKIYKNFIRANTVAFVSSIVVIFQLTVGVSTLNIFTVAAISYAMWMTLASMAVSYGASVTVITPNTETQSLTYVINIVIAVSVIFFVILSLQNFYKNARSVG